MANRAIRPLPRSIHMKMYVSFPADAFIVLGLSKISWPKSYELEKLATARKRAECYLPRRDRCTARYPLRRHPRHQRRRSWLRCCRCNSAERHSQQRRRWDCEMCPKSGQFRQQETIDLRHDGIENSSGIRSPPQVRRQVEL